MTACPVDTVSNTQLKCELSQVTINSRSMSYSGQGDPLQNAQRERERERERGDSREHWCMNNKAVHNSVMRYPSTLPGSQANTQIFGHHVFFIIFFEFF